MFAPMVQALRILRRLVSGPQDRSVALLCLRRPALLFQPYDTTRDDRYPHIFRFVRGVVGDGPHIRILSFGCSTGEEVFSLRRHFPTATIVGIDINPRNIKVCDERLAQRGGDPGLVFKLADRVAAEPLESFDAIFAMAVFRHGDLGAAPPQCDHLIRFERFEQLTGELVGSLKPGGVLAIRHANFRFSDTRHVAHFEQVYQAGSAPDARPAPVYGRDDRLLVGAVADDGVYRKGTGGVSETKRRQLSSG